MKPVKSHPAFGILTVSRVSGSRRLWGSPFTSGGFFVFRLSEARLHESFGEVRHMPDRRIAEWSMSAEQFVAMLTTMNSAEGTRCTLNDVARGPTERVPPPPSEGFGFEIDVSAEAAGEKVSEEIAQLRILVGKVAEKHKALGRDIAIRLDNLIPNLKFSHELLREAATKAKARLAAEVVATAETWLRSAGLAALAEKHPEMLPSMSVLPLDVNGEEE